MNASIGIFRDAMLWLRALLFGTSPAHLSSEAELPLRAELLSADQMDRHGKTLATLHKVGKGRAPDLLLKRLADNERILLAASSLLTISPSTA